MTIWDAVRRISGANRPKRTTRTITGERRRRGVLGSLRGRDLRMEQFEARVLLSITPPAGLDELETYVCDMAQYNYLSDTLSQAVYSASNLSHYTDAELDLVTQWVVGVDDKVNAQQLAASLSADFLASAPYLTNATIWEFSDTTSWINVASTLHSAEGIDYFYPLVPIELVPMAVPNDTLFSDQWHLQNTGQTGGTPGMDANVVPAWDFVTGAGVIISIVDTGTEIDHPDLVGHIRADLCWDFNGNDSDPSPTSDGENHGTSVSGVAAAVGNNSLGVSGSAPGAELAAERLISGMVTDQMMANALTHQYQQIDIYNNSWGSTAYLTARGPLTLAALENGATNGRGGLGNVYVWSAGNDRLDGGNVNQHQLGNSRYTIAVAALDDNGHYSYYSNPGTALMISAYSSGDPPGTTTTDRTGEDGYNQTGTADGDSLSDIDYTSQFGGTSSAAPLVSGVIALLLEANSTLTYRDVQHILVESAKLNDPSDSDWVENGAGYWVNHNYGFGAIDAAAAVQLALDWENVTEEISTGSGEIRIDRSIPDGSPTGLTSTVILDDSVESIEWVEVTFDAAHLSPGDLEVVLISPDGTRSVLAEPTSTYRFFDNSYEQWTFTSCRDWGESSEGQWTLEVRDLNGGVPGIWNSWQLKVYGMLENGGPEPPPPPPVETVVGPELISVTPNEGGLIRNGTVLHIAPLELEMLFNEYQQIDATTLGAIRMVRAGGDGVIGNANDVAIDFGWIGIGDRTNEVLVRFAETLPDDLYQITIIGEGGPDDVVLKNIDGGIFHEGENLSITFSLDLGAQITAVVPQPTYRDATGHLQQKRDTIEVYFNDDQLDSDSATDVNFYQLFDTNETDDPRDDNGGGAPITPVRVAYDPVENKAVLTFEDDLSDLGLGAFRLRVGNEYRSIPTLSTSAGVVGDTFASANNVGTLGGLTLGASLIISSAIDPLPYDLQWPGSIDEIGHRTLPSTLAGEQHSNATAADDQYGAAVVYYNFKNIYGSLPNGSPAHNLITPEQKQRTREIFELYSAYLGVQFIEDTRTGADAQGITIVTGDLRALDPTIPTGPGGVAGLAGSGVAIMDHAEGWQDGYGQSWFHTAMHEIGHLLGFRHTYDMPATTIMGSTSGEEYYAVSAEDIFPGNVDVIHGQYVYRPDGTDVDLYRFTLDAPGTFSAEVTAERLGVPSMLNSVLTVYDSTGKMVARNDDYYSDDSYVELQQLPAGEYYVAITSTGNTDFDADVAESGLGGLTQGDYELRLTFRPDRTAEGTGDVHMVDATGTQFDGDADGVPGGTYSFWFNVQSEANTLFVYKYESADVAAGRIAVNSSAPLGSRENPYRFIDDALAAAGPNKIVRILGNRDRTFSQHHTFDVSLNPTATAVGDFNRDGKMDIAAANKDDDSVSILFGLGDGTYWSDVTFDVGHDPGAIAAGDLDGDGDIDLVTVNQTDNTVSILLNNGSGSFQNQITRLVGPNPGGVALGDLNGDGKLDIVVANRNSGTISVLLSVPTGLFGDQVNYAVGATPVAVAVGDLDNDGAADVVVANQGSNNLSVLLNKEGNGTLTAVLVKPDVGSSPSSVAIADLDGDGNRDVVVANSASNNVSVLLGLGTGLFDPQTAYAAGSGPSSIDVADLDQDGSPDIVTTNRGDDTVSIFYGRLYFDSTEQASAFEYEPAVTYAVGDQPSGLTLADVDGDARPDIVTANYGSTSSGGDAVSVVLARRDEAYLIGLDRNNNPLEDGPKMEIPKGVTVMIDAGAVIKLRNANIDVGSSSLQLDRSQGALEVLGTPEESVYFTSYHDKSLGSWTTDQAAFDLRPQGGDWGGLVFRNDQDYDVETRTVLETEGIFLNYVNHAEMRYGGGQVTVNGARSVYNPIHMVEARPTVSYNTIMYSADAAMSADPRSFADTKFQGKEYTANYDRVGPDIHGNTLLGNTQNGIFVRIATQAGSVLTELDTCARFDDRDIVHIIAENLVISGEPGGPTYNGNDAGVLTARLDARLTIDPGILVKLDGARIEAEMSAQLLAEGTEAYPVIFTALSDDAYGAGGTFDTGNNASLAAPAAGDWGGLYFAPASSGSIDHAYIAYGGGETRIPGDFANFNTIEIHQATVRVANSVLAHNTGDDTGNRAGHPSTDASVIFVRGAQPILVGNVIRDNDVAAMSINANALMARQQGDSGRSTGRLDAYEEYPDNYGPLVRDNRLANNATNGMVVRGEVLSIDCVWDDTDIVHVVLDEIVVPNFHTYGGLRLQSSADESLVVKLSGTNAGLTALGTPGEVEDRIGGTLQIVGAPRFPIIFTSLADDSIGAGFDPWGATQKNTDNADAAPLAGDWRSIKLEEYVNDRNVDVLIETESAHGVENDNDTVYHAQTLGELATSEKNGDDNLRLGFEVHGFIRTDNTNDADIYSFSGRAGTEVWIDVDRTSLGLDSVIELIDADGNVIARSDNSPAEEANITQLVGPAYTMDRDIWDDLGDMYTMNVHDAGMRLVLPGAAGALLSYYVRVRSADADADGAGDSSGGYQLQVRLRETQEIAGSTIRNSNICYATNGIELLGLPTSSPLVSDIAEIEGNVVTTAAVPATANVVIDGARNDFTITATTPGVAFNNVWVVFVNGGQTGNVATATYNPAFNNNGTTIKVLIIAGDPAATTAATAVAAINAEGTFTAALTAADGGTNNGTGLITPVNTQLALTAGGAEINTDVAANDTFETAEPLGNLLDSNYGTIELSGYLTADTTSGEYDIDWYSFTLDPQHIQNIPGVGSANAWNVTFDIDYADGMGRPDTVLYVFDSTGTLIYRSDNSNVSEDQTDTLAGPGMEDLTRGSAGTGDPFLGPVTLLDTAHGDTGPATYYVAVASKARFANATGTTDVDPTENEELVLNQPLLRIEPAVSVTRIAEDNVGDVNGDMIGDSNASMIAGSPQYLLFPDPTPTELSIHVDDYHLNDVVMYVCIGTDVYAFNPFTGEYQLDLTGSNSLAHAPDTQKVLADANGRIRYGDIIMRDDGKLYSFTYLPTGAGAASTGRYRQISTADGSILSDVDDGIMTYVSDGNVPPGVIPDDQGVTFRAMIDVVEAGTRYTYAIGTRRINGTYDANEQLLFKFDQYGNPVSPGGSQEAIPTSILPWRVLTGINGFVTGLDFCDGVLCGITDTGWLYGLPGGYDLPPEDVKIPDSPPPTWTANRWTIDISENAYFIVDLDVVFEDYGMSDIPFSGLTIGPPNVESGAYAKTLFATDILGNFYAFEKTIDEDTNEITFKQSPVFLDGQSMITLGITNTMTGEVDPIGGATGVAFSTLDYNLFHVTTSRYTDEGHKITLTPDDSRSAILNYPKNGNYSYWFGFENSGSFEHPGSRSYLDDNAEVISTYDLPGGAHGTLTTNAFSLVGYTSQDSPILTFDYFLETDGTDTDIVTDSARVYISADGANWALLATNIDTPGNVMTYSDDYVPPPVYLQDGTGGWLQTRVDLSGFVGLDNLRLKFEFATAGSTLVSDSPSNSLYSGAYLRAVAGSELLDGDTFLMASDGFSTAINTTFEFDMGYSVKVPNSAGSAIPDGETLTITDDEGGTVTFEFDRDGEWDPSHTRLRLDDSDSANEVARALSAAFNSFYTTAHPDYTEPVSVAVGDRVYLCRMEANGSGIPMLPITWHGAMDVSQTPASGMELALDFEETTAPGVVNGMEGTVLVPVDAFMGPAAVAYQISRTVDTFYAEHYNGEDTGTERNPDLFTSVKCDQDLIHVLKHIVLDQGPLGYGNLLFGEESFAGREGGATTQFFFNTQGQDNAHEGWYIDNVMIGFTERGEMISNAAPDTTFGMLTPEEVTGLGAVVEGYYQLEIRLATEYSIWDPSAGTVNNRSFDTNDRLSEDLTILAPSAGEMAHLSTFTVSDGLNTQTFRFVDPDRGDFEPVDGVIDIPFVAGLRADEIAQLITAAVNAATSIDVTASNVTVYRALGSDRVLLNGATAVTGIERMVYDQEGEYPTDLELLDLNGNGVIDRLITTDQYTGTVSVLLSGKTLYDVGNLPSALELADVNGDGIQDLVVSNAGDHTVSVLLGNGNGTFETQMVFAVGTEPSNVDVFDLDGDGRIDIITTNKADNTVSILYGNGDGTFRAHQTQVVGWAPMSVTAADLNGDGLGDLVVANSRDNTVSVLLSVFGTVYADAVNYGVGRLPLDIELADMNNDGLLDILTANRVDGTVSILLGNGDGTFADAVGYFVGREPVDVEIADINDDDNLDVVTANYSANAAYVVLGTGQSDDTLRDASPYRFGVGEGPLGLGLGDLDGDLIIDIVTADYVSHDVTYLLSSVGYMASSTSTGYPRLRELKGDDNDERAQGQVIISGNEILYAAGYGIRYDSGTNDGASHPGPVAPLVKVNQNKLVPSVTIENNLIVASGISGILFSGDANDANGGYVANAAVPFGRIVNNTIYGGAAPLELLPPGDIVMPPNDDESSALLPIGFNLNFYGNTYSQMYVNNNGNITFDQSLYDFVPEGFPQATPIIAPFWADVDTRSAGEVRVAYGTSNRGNPVVQIDWIDVGYFAQHSDKKDNFTLYIEDDPAGDIVVFVYHDMQWTTGDIDGAGGFGGEGAQVGFDAGDGTNYISVARPSVLRDLEDLMDPGIYIWRLAADTGVPFGGGGTGITVSNNASPTILNNIVANLEVGIAVDTTSRSTVIGANVYQNNGTNTSGIALTQTDVVLDANEPLFVDAENGNFYLAANSKAIDSSVDSLEDRPAMKQVRDPLGISPSPILAPDYDLYGQLRSDDPLAQPPSGVGSNVFKDRGAIDRVDFSAPSATIIDPMDNDPAGIDRDPAVNDVFILDEQVTVFSIHLADTLGGIGIDDHSVTPSTVQVFRNGSLVPLVEGTDYYFVYDDRTDVVTLIAGAGLWKDASNYKIVLDNGATGIRDIAGNTLRPNRLDGTTSFTVSIINVDYGDAPDFPDDADPDYPTTEAHGGARHLLIGNYYLGAGVTGETEPNFGTDVTTDEPLTDASGDAMDDGVKFTSALLIGNRVNLDVQASVSGGYLDAWIDLNGDGDFNDDLEKIVFFNEDGEVVEQLSKGWNSLHFTLPTDDLEDPDAPHVGYDVQIGNTFARFRYTPPVKNSSGLLVDPLTGPTGVATGGEVEDYQISLVDTLRDYGDAPASYGTLAADDGAVHKMVNELYLGATVDQELDGRPSDDARGDDAHGLIDNTGEEPVVIDDEDGVQFTHWLVPGRTASVTVTASEGGGYLNAWIDFNGDGDMLDAGEKIADGLAMLAGENVVAFAVPAGAVVGETFARFRLSTDQFLAPTGQASDGEVEDYQVLVTSQPRDYGDAPRTYWTVENSEKANAHLILAGRNNDMLITAVVPGAEMNDVKIIVVNDRATGNEAIATYDDTAKELTIDVDPQKTTAATVVAAINAQVGTVFSAELNDLADTGNDGSGLLPMKGAVGTTAHGADGSGTDAAYHILWSAGSSLGIQDAIYLGSSVDAELDGQPNNTATGDDDSELDDEDGVTLPDSFTAGTTATFDVNVHLGDHETAYLHGWIDFDQDGLFSDDEKILFGTAITAGSLDTEGNLTVTVNVPMTALAGKTYARFRISTDASLSYNGPANGGEMEDYQVKIARGTGVIGGWVFEDRDSDGNFDTNEDGIPDVIVYLDENGNGVLDVDQYGNKTEPYVVSMEDDLTTSDDETGYYSFNGLPGRTTAYTVRFDSATFNRWRTTSPDHTVQFPDGSHGNDDHSYTIFLEDAETRDEVNFGNYRKPTVTVENVNVVEGDEGFTNVQVTLRMVDSFGSPVTLNYETLNDVATIDDDDFVYKKGTVTFDPQDVPPATWDLTTLTSNATNDYDYGVSGSWVAWEGFDGHDWEIYASQWTKNGGFGDPVKWTQLTNNETDDHFASVCDTGSGVNVAWVGTDGHDDEIYVVQLASAAGSVPQITRVTTNYYNDQGPQISESLVVWWADDGNGDGEIFALDLAHLNDDVKPIVNLTDNTLDDRNPVLSGRNIAWTGLRGTYDEIFAFDGENDDLDDPTVIRVTNNSRIDQAPQIDEDKIVWEGKVGSTFEIFVYDMESGSTTQITSNSREDRYPQLSGDNIVWQGHSGSNWEIYLFNTVAQGAPKNISNNPFYEEVPQIEGNQVVWRAFTGSTWEVFYYDVNGDGTVSNISSSADYDFNPQISDSIVVWRANEGGDFDIVAAVRNQPVATQTVTLRIIGDEKFEADEIFYVNFWADDNELIYIQNAKAEINILNDDGSLDYGLDLGDAPSPYPTLLVDNGARHLKNPGIYLGSGVDEEEDGQPTAAADGDDLITSDDEDGVVFASSLAQGTIASVTVTTHNTVGAGFLDAWIDFSGDGDWDDSGEHVFNHEQLFTSGATALTFAVPAGAKIGDTYARFRYSSEGSNSYTSQSPDGEVEDYRVTIASKPTGVNGVITLLGTDGDDVFKFYAGETLVVEINDARYEYPAFNPSDPASVHTILFDGGKGNDRVEFHGSSATESAELWTDRGVFRGPAGTYANPHGTYRYLVNTTNVEKLSADSGGGGDAAVLHDTTGDDLFAAGTDGAKLKTGTAEYHLLATGYATARAVSDQGGSDTASFHDSTGYDTFTATPAYAELVLDASGSASTLRAEGFDSVYAYSVGSTGIGDKASLYDSTADDTLTGDAAQVVLSGTGYRLEANNFHYVKAYAGSGGTDRANLFDSTGNDIFTAKATYIQLKDDANTYDITATGFRYTSATSMYGGTDQALMYDSDDPTVADTFEATPAFAKLYGPTFYNRADHFKKVEAHGHSAGEDVVQITGSAGDDDLIAGATTMNLTGPGYEIKADSFKHLVGFASQGFDEAHFYGTNGDDTFLGTPSYGKLTRTGGNTFRAYGFDVVEAWGLGGNDKAYLHDSDLGDLLSARGPATPADSAWAQLGNDEVNFRLWATEFEEVFAYSTSVGDKKDVDESVDDFLKMLGDWQDL